MSPVEPWALCTMQPNSRLLFEPTRISYSWQRLTPTLGDILLGAEVLSWNPPESTYKPVTLALPASAKPGESWRIGLHIGPHEPVDITHYVSPTPSIISVWSEGIALVRGEPSSSGNVKVISTSAKGLKGAKVKVQADERRTGKSRGKGKDEEGKKQGRITRDWRAGEGHLSVVEQTSFDLDKVGKRNGGRWMKTVLLLGADGRKSGILGWRSRDGYGSIWRNGINIKGRVGS